MNNKLKVRECTKCGAEMCLESVDTEFYLCPECGTYFDDEYFDSMEEAIKYWNKRPYIDNLIARSEQLEAMVEKLNDLIDELVNAGNQPRHRNWQDNWDAIVYRIIREREK